jgi:DtxR family Mn-dependent transcriptional regulator
MYSLNWRKEAEGKSMDSLLIIVSSALVAVAGSVVVYVIRQRRKRVQDEIRQDVLKQVYHLIEKQKDATVESLAGALHLPQDTIASVINTLGEKGYLQHDGDRLRLTATGIIAALEVIRSHRLWERYLADETGVGESQWHNEAEKQEHRLSREEADALSKRLGHPLYDPHGDPIPQKDLGLPEPKGHSMTTANPGEEYVVIHLEDEPAAVYKDILESGILRGSRVRYVGKDATHADLDLAGRRIRLTLLSASNITVVPARGGRPIEHTGSTLGDIREGSAGKVVSLSPACRGMQRRRLLDLGVLPGTVITAELVSPAGDPTAYRIRGALVALRKTEASFVNVETWTS